MSFILDIFDKYTIRARFLPSLISILPLVALISTFLDWNKFLLANAMVATIMSFVLVSLMSKFSRTQGLKAQKNLLKEWEVFPTTQYLRHRDNTYSFTKKQKIHELLSTKSSIVLPTIQEERDDYSSADEIYGEAVSWLIENTRDSSFKILLNENINYGFFRNSLGLKKIAYIICIIPLLTFSIILLLNYPDINKMTLDNFVFFITNIRLAYWLTSFLSIILLFYWIFFINRKNVRAAAELYANTLLKQINIL